jgi:hypothetical protein
MKLLDMLEKRLLEHLRRQESRKTWQQWMEWLQTVGCPIQLPRPEKVSPVEQLNFQRFVLYCESALARHNDWQTKFSTPGWLQSHQLVVIPQALFAENAPASSPKAPVQADPDVQYVTEADLAGTQQAMLRLAEEVDRLRTRMEQLEAQQRNFSGGGAAPSAPPRQSFQPSRPPLPQEEPRPPLRQPTRPPGAAAPPAVAAQVMEKELRLMQQPERPKEFVPESFDDEPVTQPVAQPVALDEAYLSINHWCDHLFAIGLNLQDLADEDLRVTSNRPISFRQFGHRMERRVRDQAQLHSYLEQFRLHYRDGIVPAPPEVEMPGLTPDVTAENEDAEPDLQELLAESSAPEGFLLPPDDIYQDYNTWLGWLAEQGVDVMRFASQDLQVMSSHRISFPQFCRRLERKLDDPQAFRAELGLD